MTDLVSTGKFISLILRHKPETIGIALDEHGWADVEEQNAGIQKTRPDFNREILEEIVRTNNKQRYSFNEDHSKIRANQGHSIAVDVDLKEEKPPEILYHGTGEKSVPSIREEGLVPRSRLYVHMSKDIATAIQVGSRHGKPVVFTVQSGRMYEAGFKFWISKNDVWLTKEVPPEYLAEDHRRNKDG
ncbi:MAG: RNA 2'-phosphotransferase [Clostridia bacterium]|nr:RNA 2'-phosphotransferase [Clostridia bacterium]